jgi:Transposase DDE domain group 1
VALGRALSAHWVHCHQPAAPAERVVAFYNKRGTAEQWIKEGKGAIKWTRLSCRTFAANAVRLQLHALAYNLGNFLRTLATPEPIKDWSRGGCGRSSAISRRISWNICRGMATSAIWKTTYPWLTTFAPILISFTFKLLVLSRGGFCPKERRQDEGLVRLHRELGVAYCRLVRAISLHMFDVVGSPNICLRDLRNKITDTARYSMPFGVSSSRLIVVSEGAFRN